MNIAPHLNAHRIVFVFAFVNLLNYIDRGIVAGAGKSIQGCVRTLDDCPSLPTNVTDVCDLSHCTVCGSFCDGANVTQTGFGINTEQLAYLQSSFMVGYSIAAVAFGNLVHRFDKFRLIFVGLTLWLVSAFLSGVSGMLCHHAEGSDAVCPSYYVILFGRILSGVGEASVATLATPVLDDILPSSEKGFYLAIYFSAIPLGTALGFMYAGVVTEITGKWEWAFLLEIFPMVPFCVLCFSFPSSIIDQLKKKRILMDQRMAADQGESVDQGAYAPVDQGTNESNAMDSTHENDEDDLTATVPNTSAATYPHALEEPMLDILDQSMNTITESNRSVSLRDDIWACVSSPLYMLAVIGFSQYTGVTAGLAFYGPKFIQDYRPEDPAWEFSQLQTDLLFGGIVAMAGFLGSTLGGLVIDKCLVGVNGEDRCVRGFAVITVEAFLGLLAVLPIPFMTQTVPFFILFGIGVTIIFTCNTTGSMILLFSVPEKNRPMAMALSVIFLHVLGDVPSPIVIGRLSDKTDPQFTLFCTLAWFSWCVVLWLVGYLFAKGRQSARGRLLLEDGADA